MNEIRILLVPPNDLLRHPLPNRMYHIAKRLARYYRIYLLAYPGHPLAGNVRRSLEAVEVAFKRFIRTSNLGIYYVVNYFQMYAEIRRTLRSEGIDAIVHANILPSLIASHLARKLGIPNIYDFLDYFPESASAYYARGKGFVELGVKELIYAALRNSDIVVTPSLGLKEVVKSMVPEKPVRVIPNGVDAELFKPIEQRIARKSIGLDEGGHFLLLLGSLDVWLDVENVLRALSKLRKSIDVRLLVVGFSHAKLYYRLLLEYAKLYGVDRYIHTYPPQPYERVPLFINSSDIVFAPYKRMIKNVATPLKIAEALACGVPVITTNIAEFKIWYKQGIYTYSTYEELENVMKYLLSNLDKIKAELRKYSNSFREVFSWENLAEKYRSVILETVVQTPRHNYNQIIS